MAPEDGPPIFALAGGPPDGGEPDGGDGETDLEIIAGLAERLEARIAELERLTAALQARPIPAEIAEMAIVGAELVVTLSDGAMRRVAIPELQAAAPVITVQVAPAEVTVLPSPPPPPAPEASPPAPPPRVFRTFRVVGRELWLVFSEGPDELAGELPVAAPPPAADPLPALQPVSFTRMFQEDGRFKVVLSNGEVSDAGAVPAMLPVTFEPPKNGRGITRLVLEGAVLSAVYDDGDVQEVASLPALLAGITKTVTHERDATGRIIRSIIKEDVTT
jgi:hypothetical protein